MNAWYLVVCFVMMTSNGLYGYRKFQCVTYDYKIADKQSISGMHCLSSYGLSSFAPTKADYVIKGSKGVTSWVKLSLADKRHMRRLRSLFSPSTVVTDAMITSFLHSKERMKWKVVGLILRDFKTAYGRNVTIGDIMYTLKL